MSGLDFRYSGVIRLHGGEKYEKANGEKAVTKDMNIISGSITKAVYSVERGCCRLTVPTTGKDGETEFHSITVWNSDRNPQAAENANKFFAPYEKDGVKVYKRGIFVCGENTHFGKAADDPDTGNSYTCFRYEFIPKSGGENTGASPSKNEEAPEVASDPVAEEEGYMSIPDAIDEFADAEAGELPWKE